MMRLAERLDRLSTAIEKIAGLFLAAITVLVFVSAIGRYAFAAPIPDAFDVARLMLGVAMLWGFASVGYRGAHIKVDLVAEVLPARVCFWLDVVASSFCCCSPCCSPGCCSAGSRAPTPATNRPSICACRCGRGSRPSGSACSLQRSRSRAGFS
jgi:Tripartite ATP-independent periplasmic transporters, DctQ component